MGTVLVEQGVWIGEGEAPDAVIAEDLISFTDSRLAPIRDPKGGVRFVDLSDPYDEEGRRDLESACLESGLSVVGGVLVGLPAPELLTGAEKRAFRRLGAAAATASVPQETKKARALGRKVLGVAILSDRAKSILRELAASIGWEEQSGRRSGPNL